MNVSRGSRTLCPKRFTRFARNSKRFTRNASQSHETLNGLHETFLARKSHVFGVVVRFRVCKFCHHATILNLHIVLKNLEIFLNKEVILEKRLRVL